MIHKVRNIAIVAHVDHGKTTLVDKLLHQVGTFSSYQNVSDRIMDSNDLEKERGITIFSKNCSIQYKDVQINIIDTPGHADFGGEVERVLSMVEGVLLLVDGVDGPMPQTRFVTKKALALGLRPIVVVNKADRPQARPDWVVDRTFDLFDNLGASEDQLDFQVVYASAIEGWAVTSLNDGHSDMNPLLDLIIEHVPTGNFDKNTGLQLQVCSLDYSSFVGRIGIGKITCGRIEAGQKVSLYKGPSARPETVKINQILKFMGIEQVSVGAAVAGDIILFNGIDNIEIGDTICDIDLPKALPMIKVDDPTLTMKFMVNNSPLSGGEGDFVTSRQLKERLERELQSNVALKVDFSGESDTFVVSGRGELHLTILLENMRREGYELAVGRPEVVYRDNGGVKEEPYELLTVEIVSGVQGAVIEDLGRRRGELINLDSSAVGRVRLEYKIPAKNLIGFQSHFLTLTKGDGIAHHVFDSYGPISAINDSNRRGVLVSQVDGKAVGYALWKLQERGRLFVKPGDAVYEGMIIGINNRDNDLVVNPIKAKQLTNVRASGKDDAINLVPPIDLTLEKAIGFIADDELVEITPKDVRLRKYFLKEYERRRANR